MMTKLPKIEPSGVEPSFNKEAERTICGVGLSEWRKAYFKGKLPKLLADMQADKKPTEDGLVELKNLLDGFRKGEELLVKQFSDFLPEEEKDLALDSIDELETGKLTPAEEERLVQDRENTDKAFNLAERLIRRVGNSYLMKDYAKFSQDDLINLSFELLALDVLVGKDEIYKERLYRQQITRYEKLGKQRKLAEEYAKVSKEYRDWRLAEKLEKRIDSWVMLAKKRYKSN